MNESLTEISLYITFRSIYINLKQVIQHVPLVSLILFGMTSEASERHTATLSVKVWPRGAGS
jgi:hypothetical protein